MHKAYHIPKDEVKTAVRAMNAVRNWINLNALKILDIIEGAPQNKDGEFRKPFRDQVNAILRTYPEKGHYAHLDITPYWIRLRVQGYFDRGNKYRQFDETAILMERETKENDPQAEHLARAFGPLPMLDAKFIAIELDEYKAQYDLAFAAEDRLQQMERNLSNFTAR